jgi:hypothetical protein
MTFAAAGRLLLLPPLLPLDKTIDEPCRGTRRQPLQRSSSETESLHTSSSTHLLMESTGYAEDMQVGGACWARGKAGRHALLQATWSRGYQVAFADLHHDTTDG